jgi:hypothetical protein
MHSGIVFMSLPREHARCLVVRITSIYPFHRRSPDCALGYGPEVPTMHLYPIDGAVHRVGRHETAFSYREATWSAVFVGVDPDPDNNERIISWTKEYWDAVHPHSGGGAYVNFMMDEGQERVKATYRDNFERLVAIKNKYDPTNLFRVNQNIRPTTSV